MNPPTHHPDELDLLDFASGALESRRAEFVGMHLRFCPQCKQDVELLEAAGGSLLLSTEAPAPASPASVSRAVDSLVGLVVGTNEREPWTEPRQQASELNFDSPGWRVLAPGVRFLTLVWPDRTRALLIGQANASLPLGGKARPPRPLVVLRGALDDLKRNRYGRGDFVPEDAQIRVAQEGPCIYLLGVARTRRSVPEASPVVPQ